MTISASLSQSLLLVIPILPSESSLTLTSTPDPKEWSYSVGGLPHNVLSQLLFYALFLPYPKGLILCNIKIWERFTLFSFYSSIPFCYIPFWSTENVVPWIRWVMGEGIEGNCGRCVLCSNCFCCALRSFVMWLCNSSSKKWSPSPCSSTLDWPCVLLWPTECKDIDIVWLGLKSPCNFCYFHFYPLGMRWGSQGWPLWRRKDIWRERLKCHQDQLPDMRWGHLGLQSSWVIKSQETLDWPQARSGENLPLGPDQLLIHKLTSETVVIVSHSVVQQFIMRQNDSQWHKHQEDRTNGWCFDVLFWYRYALSLISRDFSIF